MLSSGKFTTTSRLPLQGFHDDWFYSPMQLEETSPKIANLIQGSSSTDFSSM